MISERERSLREREQKASELVYHLLLCLQYTVSSINGLIVSHHITSRAFQPFFRFGEYLFLATGIHPGGKIKGKRRNFSLCVYLRNVLVRVPSVGLSRGRWGGNANLSASIHSFIHLVLLLSFGTRNGAEWDSRTLGKERRKK